MNTVILRRRKLGRTSAREIAANMQNTQAIRNDKQFPANVDLVFRWGTTSNVPVRNVVNTAEAIHEVNDKLGFRRILNEHELCPPTWNDEHQANQQGTYPMIVRRDRHAQGRNLHVCHNYNELMAACNRYANYYISALINKVAEYRVMIVQGRVAWVANKTPGNPEDVAWNVARGGRFDNVRFDNWPLKAVRMSIEAFNLSSLDFGAVDIMQDAEGNCYVLEINSAPSQTSPYRQQCVAKCFDWIVRNGKERIPLVERKGGWKKFVHPAISGEAQLV